MAKATGVVQFVKSEVKQSNRTGKSFQVHSIKMDDEWYNCGFNDPGVFEGDNVEIIYDSGKYGRDVEKGNVTRISGPLSSGKANVPTGQTNAPAATVSKDNRQDSIHFQSSRKDAIAVAELAIKHDLLKLPTAQNKKLDAVLQFVDHMTNQYYNDVTELKTGTGAVVQEPLRAVGDDD